MTAPVSPGPLRVIADAPPGLRLETLDLLYDAFVRGRATDDWGKELSRMQKWLKRDEHSRAAG